MGRSTIALLALLAPLLLRAQTPSAEAPALRAKAIAEGSVEVHVVTRAVALSKGATLTPERKAQIARDQNKVVMLLITHNLIVGNAITIQSDGSFVMRVLPEALDQLARTGNVQLIEEARP